MKRNRESFFWTSYSDLMTSLFFVMLVLFVLTMALLHRKMVATEQELEQIKHVEKSTKDLSREYFSYNADYKKYVLKVKCFFNVNKYNIQELDKNTRDSLKMAGEEINKFLERNHENKYLLVVEGQASMNSEKWSQFNYELSFRRALALVDFWSKDCKIQFSKNCEIQIAGSGDGRLNVDPMRDKTEKNNQRFLIHIVPKNIITENY